MSDPLVKKLVGEINRDKAAKRGASVERKAVVAFLVAESTRLLAAYDQLKSQPCDKYFGFLLEAGHALAVWAEKIEHGLHLVGGVDE